MQNAGDGNAFALNFVENVMLPRFSVSIRWKIIPSRFRRLLDSGQGVIK